MASPESFTALFKVNITTEQYERGEMTPVECMDRILRILLSDLREDDELAHQINQRLPVFLIKAMIQRDEIRRATEEEREAEAELDWAIEQWLSTVEIILQVGVDGGLIALLKDAGGWRFHTVAQGFDSRDARISPKGRPAYRRESQWADSWDAALALLDKHPWFEFYPIAVHPDFRQQVAVAVAERFEAAYGSRIQNLERWRRLCSEGDA